MMYHQTLKLRMFKMGLVFPVMAALIGCDPIDPNTVAKKKSAAPDRPGATSTWPPTPLDEIPERQPGTHQQMVKQKDGSQTTFTLKIPDNYDRSKKTPLIVALHFGGSGPFYGKGILEGLVAPALEELNAIIVAPDVIAGRGGWGTLANETALFDLMDSLIETYNIDDQKILVTGFSMGGHGTFYFASRFQDRFTAAIPIAGSPRGVPPQTEWKIPLRVIHSNADKRVVIGPAKSYVEKIKSEGADASFVELEELGHGPVTLYQPALKDSVKWILSKWEE